MAIREQWGWLMEMPAVWFDKSFFQLPVTLAAVHNTSVFIKKYSFHPSPLPPPYSLSAWMKHRSHVINKCCKCRHLMTGCQGNSVGRCHWGSRRSVSWLHSCWTCWHVHSNALLHAYKHRGARVEVISCALLREALFSVCFVFSAHRLCFLLFSLQVWQKWVPPVDHRFTFSHARSLVFFSHPDFIVLSVSHTHVWKM